MCGIAGVHGSSGRPCPHALLLDMAGELAHRGPDGVGLYLDGHFGMVNTRLSIIDIEGGDQPLSNGDGRYWVMQNGEIYNFPELRDELRSLGHRFATRSDTEVIAHAFEAWGERCLERFEGEFAIAVWDRLECRLFLARDRFGIRPLFVACYGSDVLFASEARALLRHPLAERRFDPAALLDTFTLWGVQPDRSAYVGIRELPPGHALWVDEHGASEPRRWWDIAFAPREGEATGSPDALAEELLALLDEAVRVRLRADVPVGVYVSGGLDSSVTAALARRHTRGTLHGFAVGFDDPRFDETREQDVMADALGLAMTRVVVSPRDVAQALPEVVLRAEKPLLRTAPGPLMLLSAAVRETGIRVVLTGEGADEMFGGYELFQEAMVRRFWARRPESRIRPLLLRRLYPHLARDLTRSGAFLTEFFRVGLEDVEDPLFSHRPRIRTTMRNLRLLRPEVLAAAEEAEPLERLRSRLPAAFERFGPLGRAQYLEIATFLSGYLLHAQGDRMLMANGVEGRFPFLDARVAAFAAALPERLRLNGLREKYLLRRAVHGIVPEAIARRRKRAYRAPVFSALFGPSAPEYVREVLAPERLRAAGVFAEDRVGRLVEKADRFITTGLGESDEMGLVGVLSTQLLIEQTVLAPQLAPPAVARRIVRGDTVVIDASPVGGEAAEVTT